MIRRRQLILKAALIRAAIEFLPAIWLIITVDMIHESIAAGILLLFHLPSIAAAWLLLRPVESRMSKATYKAVSWPLAFIIQVALIGGIAFIFLYWRERRRAHDGQSR